jgi:hypothetical protein
MDRGDTRGAPPHRRSIALEMIMFRSRATTRPFHPAWRLLRTDHARRADGAIGSLAHF